MKEYLGLDNRELDHDLVECAACHNFQYEYPHPLNKGGKYAWQCRSCSTANENGDVYPLIKYGVVAWYDTKRGLGF